jgi:hemoglobin
MTESGDAGDDPVRQTSEEDNDGPTLYERLGGRESIEAVVGRFYEHVMADDLVNHYFEDTDMQRQIGHQTQFISSVTGGPVEYTGEDMRAAHAGMGITEVEFTAIAEHLDTALKEFNVPENDREDVLDEIASYEDAIIGA